MRGIADRGIAGVCAQPTPLSGNASSLALRPFKRDVPNSIGDVEADAAPMPTLRRPPLAGSALRQVDVLAEKQKDRKGSNCSVGILSWPKNAIHEGFAQSQPR
jgi:hypothetical protein